MSVVSGVTLLCSSAEPDEIVALLERWAAVNYGSVQFNEVDDHYGGNKHPQQRVIGAGLNYFDEDNFAALAMLHKWEFPENVVLVIQPEDGPTRVFRPATDA